MLAHLVFGYKMRNEIPLMPTMCSSVHTLYRELGPYSLREYGPPDWKLGRTVYPMTPAHGYRAALILFLTNERAPALTFTMR